MRIVHRVHNGKLVAVNQEPPRKKSRAERRKDKAAAIAAKRRAAAEREQAATVERDTPEQRHARAAIYHDFTLSGMRHFRDL